MNTLSRKAQADLCRITRAYKLHGLAAAERLFTAVNHIRKLTLIESIIFGDAVRHAIRLQRL